jgi:outer membrane protein assembly factor BamB
LILATVLLTACSTIHRIAGDDAGRTKAKPTSGPAHDSKRAPSDGGNADDSGAFRDAGIPPAVADLPDVHNPVSDTGLWPQMGYDERNWYLNPSETTLTVGNAPTLELKWRFKIPVAGFPPGTPIVAESKVFVMATGGTFALNLKDGSLAWERRDLKGTASLAYANGAVYAHVGMPPELYKLDAATGNTLWGPVLTYDLKGADGTSSPILAGEVVLVGHSAGLGVEVNDLPEQPVARGGVQAFDQATGLSAWHYYTVSGTEENGAMVWSSVGVDMAAGVVFATTGNNYTLLGGNSDAFHAIDLVGGVKQWVTQVQTDDVWSLPGAPTGPDTDFGANPIVGEVGDKKIVAAGNKSGTFFMLDRETGAILWSRENLSNSRTTTHGGVLMNGAFDGKTFYAVANQPEGPGKAMLHALDAMKDGADVWPPINLPKYTWGAPSLGNGVLVVPNDDDLLIFEAATGKELKRFSTGGTIAAGAAVIADGKIIVQSGLQYQYEQRTTNNNSVTCYGLP